MSMCGREGTATCSTENPSSTETNDEAKWIGVTAGCAVFLLCIIWLIRNCSDKTRRRRVVDKLCCLSKEDQTDGPPGYSENRNGACVEDAPIYYRAPPAYDEIVKSTNGVIPTSGSQRGERTPLATVSTVSETAGNHHKIEGHVMNRPRPIMRKSRSTISMMTLSLATIQEDANEARPSLADVLSVVNTQTQNSVPHPSRSKSYPAQLSDLVLHFNADNLRDKDKKSDGNDDENEDIDEKEVHPRARSVSCAVPGTAVQFQLKAFKGTS